MKILSWFFNIVGKYYEQEESYEKSGKGLGPFGKLLLLALTASVPILTFYWANNIIPADGGQMIGKIFLYVLAFCFLVKTPQELLILSIVAFRHGFWVLVTRKSEKNNEKVTEVENNKKKKRKITWEKINSNPLWDFIIGILGIVMAFATVFLVVLGFAIS